MIVSPSLDEVLAHKGQETHIALSTSLIADGLTPLALFHRLEALGWACELYQQEVFKGLPCKRIQCDEIWSFCYGKTNNLPLEKRKWFGFGDVWTWVALDADTKLVPSYMVGRRDAPTAG